MTTFTGSSDLQGATFNHVNLHGARIVGSDVSEMVMRGVDIAGTEIDAPWLVEGGDGQLLVNGVNVAPFVEAELNRRFPGRAERLASDPDGLRTAWASLERTWAATLDRVAALSPEVVDISVAGEWSFAQTLRHLILATDMWLGRAVLEIEQPFHPLALMDAGSAADGWDLSVFATDPPTYQAVLEARAGRVAMVREFLAEVTAEQLAAEHRNPHAPEYPETTLSCLHTIIEEEWEHHRYAVRDLDVIESGAPL